MMNNKPKQRQWCWACVICCNSCVSPPRLRTLAFSQTNIRDFGDSKKSWITREEINFWFKKIKVKLSETQRNWSEEWTKYVVVFFFKTSLQKSSEIWNVLCDIFLIFQSNKQNFCDICLFNRSNLFSNLTMVNTWNAIFSSDKRLWEKKHRDK